MVSIALPIGPVGVQTLGETAEPDPARSQLVDDGENVLGVASEAIELPDREHVAFAEVVEAGIELWTASRRTADAVVGEDAGGTGLAKRVELKLGVLVGGRHPCVSDDGHDRSCLIIPSHPRF